MQLYNTRLKVYKELADLKIFEDLQLDFSRLTYILCMQLYY